VKYFQVFGVAGTWIIVGMTVDRYIAVCYPLQSKSICTPKRAKIILSVLFTVMAIYNLPFYFFARSFGKNMCVSLAVSSTFATVMSWVGSAMNSVIPFSIILTLNSLIINAIRKRRQHFKKDQDKDASCTGTKVLNYLVES